MKKRFKIFQIVKKDILTPSTDYYSRGNSSDTDTVTFFEEQQYYDEEDNFVKLFDSEQEAIDFMATITPNEYTEGDYVILPVYTIK